MGWWNKIKHTFADKSRPVRKKDTTTKIHDSALIKIKTERTIKPSKEEKRIRFDKEKEKLFTSESYVLIQNFAKKYHNLLYKNKFSSVPFAINVTKTNEYEEYLRRKSVMEDELEILQKLLNSKGFVFGVQECHLLLCEEARNQAYQDFERKILFNKPEKIEDYLRNLLGIYGDEYKTYIKFLHSLLLTKGIKISINKIIEKIPKVKETLELSHFENRFGLNNSITTSLEEIDSMNGFKFEGLLKHLFERMGYTVEQTKLTGDQGADLVVSKFGEITVIQAKRSKSKIGNEAIQEVVASISYYNAQKGMVVTNNYFTVSAKELAKSNKVSLIDRDNLRKLVEEYL